MSEFFRDWFFWCYLYVQHVFVMMYWATIPGLLFCGLLSVRYRGVIREGLLRGGGGLRTSLYAIGLGMTTPAGRRESLVRASTLMSAGVSPIAVLAYFIATAAPEPPRRRRSTSGFCFETGCEKPGGSSSKHLRGLQS